MSPLMACCCNPCTEDCPADGEDDPCELDSWASSYNVAMSVSWDATKNGSAVSAGFEDDGETYTQITNPACQVGGAFALFSGDHQLQADSHLRRDQIPPMR